MLEYILTQDENDMALKSYDIARVWFLLTKIQFNNGFPHPLVFKSKIIPIAYSYSKISPED